MSVEQFFKKCPEVPTGNTDKPVGTPFSFFDKKLRTRWIPSFTSYKDEPPFFNETVCKYLCYGKEICPTTGREHWQGCAYFFDKVSPNMAQKLLKIKDQHIENIPRTDDMSKAITYCKKDGKFQEFGIPPEQGKRTDLDNIKNEILNGDLKVDDILSTRPMMYHQYGRTLDKIEDLKMSKVFRTEMTKCIWYYGTTGVGKSHKAFENYTPETHYVHPNDKGWWDNYKQQETVILNDFRGEIPYNTLLQIVDKWVYNVPRRGRAPLPFTSKMVIITSSLHPAAVYNKRDAEDSLEQLLDRIEIVELKGRSKRK